MLINTCFIPYVLIVLHLQYGFDDTRQWWWSHDNDPWLNSEMQSSDVMDNQMKVFDPLPLTKEGSDIVLQKYDGILLY